MKRAAFFVALLASASRVGAAGIGLFADPDCGSCNLSIPAPPGIGTFYVAAQTAGDPVFQRYGIDGLEFRIAGLPPGWLAFPVALLFEVPGADEAVRLVRSRYGNQLARMVELLDSQSAADAARADLVRAEIDLLQARGDLEYAAGTLLAWAVPGTGRSGEGGSAK